MIRSCRLVARSRVPCFFSSQSTKKLELRKPSEVYLQLVQDGNVCEDHHQLRALEHLDILHNEIEIHHRNNKLYNYHQDKSVDQNKETNSQIGWIFNLFQNKDEKSLMEVKKEHDIKSFYFWGGTGSGKTFLMDMFYENLHFLELKRRVHYNNFMLDIHSRLFKYKNNLKSASQQKFSFASSETDSQQMWNSIASDIYNESVVLCIDEFQVTDIADAMILKVLFESLLSRGVILVMTSNRPPSELYKNGLQRSLFLPFISMLENVAVVHSIKDSDVDYRVIKHDQIHKGFFFTPDNKKNSMTFGLQFASHLNPSIGYSSDQKYQSLMSSLDLKTLISLENYSVEFLSSQLKTFCGSRVIFVQGRKFTLPHSLAGRSVSLSSFEHLCGSALGSADYIQLASKCSVLFLANVPQLSILSRNELRRFILLVDSLYEAKVRLVILSRVPILSLLSLTAKEKEESTYDEVFAFDRTVSRLLEMQSEEYFQTTMAIRPLGIDYLASLGLSLKSLELYLINKDSFCASSSFNEVMINIFNQYSTGDDFVDYSCENNSEDKNSEGKNEDNNYNISREMRISDFKVLLQDLYFTYRAESSFEIVNKENKFESLKEFIEKVLQDAKILNEKDSFNNTLSYGEIKKIISKLDLQRMAFSAF